VAIRSCIFSLRDLVASKSSFIKTMKDDLVATKSFHIKL
jgi:hypothetical protein